ncbi:PAS domain-containing sensor histidine kinase [Fervidibacillus albus]|uniref:histidine kinase n=1 Tax=Fervidibacillus albus TaxID=2980026 RepID=A0A9E8LX10_9BACI|nr:PAS domain-containing sensor histidine kinase [Fervidibacillus albus]WAA11134.1 ATP-binding protein [Fervidibacillus albus]
MDQERKDLQKRIVKLEEENGQLKSDLDVYKTIYLHAPEPMILLDSQNRFIDANGAAEVFFEMDLSKLRSKTFFDFLYMSPYNGFEHEEKGSIFKDERLIELEDGKIKQVEVYVFRDLFPKSSFLILKDVTSHKRLEWERTMHLELFNKIFNQIIDGLILFDESGNIVNANPSFCKLMGIAEETLSELSFHQLFSENEQGKYRHFWESLQETGSFFGEVQLTWGQNVKFFEMSTSSKVYNGLYISILRDITEKKNMEQEKLNSEEKFRKVFHGTFDGMLLWKEVSKKGKDRNRKVSIVDVNDAGLSILNVKSCSDLQEGKVLLYLIDQEGKHEFLSYLQNTFVNGEDGTIVRMEVDKQIKNIEFYSKRNIFQDVHLTIFRDVTERLKMEDQLRKSDMLNVIGELAAGIAHEIRNPMTSLKGFIQLLKGSVDGYSMYFNIIMAELERIESIVNEFLVLSKPQVVHYKMFNVVQIMKETIELLHPQAMMENIQIRTDFEVENFPIYCEPNQIKQVFINIIKNAIEVMPKGRFITITISRLKKHFVKVSIQDEGSGISKDKIKKLGQPFYTTKERGTGLGLMISYKIIKEHGGKIEVESELGKGTVFHVMLPIDKRRKKIQWSPQTK